jgi:hypothetical protein
MKSVANCVRMDMGEEIALKIGNRVGMASCKGKYSKLPILL